MKNAWLFILGLSFLTFGTLHKDSRTTQVHSPFRWVFADSAARVAESVTTSDTDKVAYQKSDSSIWVLRDNSPKTWISLSSGSNVKDEAFDSIYSRTGVVDSIFSTKIYLRDTALIANAPAYTSGTDSASVVGFSDKDSIYVEWNRVGNLVFMHFPNLFTGTSSSNEFRINIPSSMPPIGMFFAQSLPSNSFAITGSVIGSDVVLTTENSGSRITILYDGMAFGWPEGGTFSICVNFCIMYWTV
ncbi:MAG: hypothetical protein PHN44_00105 [Candidatus Marinimicrobia bacterium]|nr:hypothetical protein [Candidatus Neomarinimicrobiota bacterium]